MIVEPPLETGAVKETDACPLPAEAVPIVGAPGKTAFAVYVRLVGLVSDGLLVGVRVIDPEVVGVMVNVCAVLELEKVRVMAESPVLPAPLGIMVIVPVYEALGVTVKLVEAVPTLPLDGPVKV